MELTVEEALEHGVAAHKAGNLEEAGRLYKLILQSVPNHSDANHNLGVIAVSTDRFEDSLPYLKTALESNPNQGQYWISYIDALIKLGQIDNAQKVFEQGKKIGLKGSAVDELEIRLNNHSSIFNKFFNPFFVTFEMGISVPMIRH